MNNKLLWTLIGFAFFLLLIPVDVSFYNDYQVYKNGTIVVVTINYLPGNLSSRKDFMKFAFDGVTYDKKVSLNFARMHRIGETIDLKYLPGYENNFLFDRESPITSGISCTFLFVLLGVWSFYYAYKNQGL